MFHFNIDTREFNRVFREKTLNSSRSIARNVNGAALAVAVAARKHTKVANISDIEKLSDLRTFEKRSRKTGKVLIDRKTGLARTITARVPNIIFRAIYASYLWKANKNPKTLSSKQFASGMMAAYKSRISNVHYLRSGWNTAIRIIGRAIGKTDNEPKKSKNVAKGGGTPAKEGWNPIATIETRAGLNPKMKSASSYLRVLKIHQAALKASIDENIGDMKKHIIESQKKIWNAS